jgi:PKD repeat protein
MKRGQAQKKKCRSLALVLLVVLLAIAEQLNAAIVIENGTASAGVEGACSALGVPPSSFPPGVSYGEADLISSPTGSIGDMSRDWAGVSWRVSAGDTAGIIASGWSREGFNLALCQSGGWFYGRGHADFSVTFTLDRAYQYISTVSGNVTGISNGEGSLGAGTYIISGQSLGNPPGGFSLDVALSPVPLEPPVASFVFSPQDPVAGELVTFTSTSTDSDGQITTWQWDFGDGNTAQGEIVNHTYTEAGDFTVTLTVTDNDGLTDSSLQVILVILPDIPSQQCVGAEGSQCDNNIFGLVGVKRNRDGSYTGTVSVGSILHDNCCIINYPNGRFCNNGGDQSVCEAEWNKALSNSNLRTGRGWKVRSGWGPYDEGEGDDITLVPARNSQPQAEHETRATSRLAAPSGTELDITDEDFCESKIFRRTDARRGFGICF